MIRFISVFLAVFLFAETGYAKEGRLENSWRYREGDFARQNSVELAADNQWTLENVDGAVKKGIDVSRFQGDVDWKRVKKTDVDFAIIRCGYGDDMESQDDPYWLKNAEACVKENIPFGVYIYSYAINSEQAKSEAEHVLRLVKGYKLRYPIYIDIEDDTQSSLSETQLADIAETFCGIIQKEGYDVGVYANKYWWENKLISSVFDNNSWHKWVAQYNSVCTYEKKYTMWQCADNGSVDGINGGVDINFWFGEDIDDILFGDADMNGVLTAADSAVVLKKALDDKFIMPIEKAEPVKYSKIVDVDGDNEITVKDASIILNIVQGLKSYS